MRSGLRFLLFLFLAALTAWGVWLIVLFGFIHGGNDPNPLIYWSAFVLLVVVVALVLWAAVRVGRPFLDRLTGPS